MLGSSPRKHSPISGVCTQLGRRVGLLLAAGSFPACTEVIDRDEAASAEESGHDHSSIAGESGADSKHSVSALGFGTPCDRFLSTHPHIDSDKLNARLDGTSWEGDYYFEALELKSDGPLNAEAGVQVSGSWHVEEGYAQYDVWASYGEDDELDDGDCVEVD